MIDTQATTRLTPFIGHLEGHRHPALHGHGQMASSDRAVRWAQVIDLSPVLFPPSFHAAFFDDGTTTPFTYVALP